MEKDKSIFDHLKPRKIEVPDPSYFEQLAKKVALEEKKIVPLYRKPLTWITAVAATVAVILMVSLFESDMEQKEDVLLALNEISKDDIQAYIEEHIDDFETEMIAEFIPVEQLIPTDSTEEKTADPVRHSPPFIPEDIDTEEILDYFRELGIDPEDIEEESFI